MLLFGNAQVESFFIIDLDKGIKKHVTSISSRQDANAILSVYASAYKEYNKEYKKQLKELQEKNTDYSTPELWYQDFFKKAIDDRQKLQTSFISGRLRLQEVLTQEEWDKIFESTKANLETLTDKKKKKKDKKEGKDPFMRMTKTIEETIPPGEKQTGARKALTDFKEKYNMSGKSFENLSTDESEILFNRLATREDLQKIGDSLNKLRKSLIDGYLEMLFEIKKRRTLISVTTIF